MADITPFTLRLEFRGPFGWTARDGVPCIFDVPEGKRRGLYVWTIAAASGELAYYVGETGRSFSQRHFEHLKEHLAGAYHVFEPTPFKQGRKVELWPGHYGPRPRPTIAQWLQRYESLAPVLIELVEVYRFFVAEATWVSRIRHRAEAAIARAMRESPHDFQDDGVRYWPRRSDEEPMELVVESSRPILGLLDKLTI